MSKNYCSKISYILILIGFIYSIINSITDTIKYDKFRIASNGKEVHSIIRSDIDQYWTSATNFKNDIDEDKGFFKSGSEIKHSY